MGFGTLFIGYFLLLNITNYVFTDVIAAMIMLLGLYKLSSVSRYFRPTLWCAVVFAVLGFGEAVLWVTDLLFTPLFDNTVLVSAIAIARSVVLCALTLVLLRAIHGIAKELEVERVPLKCRTMSIWTTLLYATDILFETPFISSLIPTEASAVIYIVIIVGTVIVLISNLTIIYTCYRWICMPEDLNGRAERPSRFEFVNEYRRRKAEKQARDEAEMRRIREEKQKRKKKK